MRHEEEAEKKKKKHKSRKDWPNTQSKASDKIPDKRKKDR